MTEFGFLIRTKYLILLLILFSTTQFAQKSKQVGWMSKFGMAGGVNASWYFPDYSEVNNQLQSFGIQEKFEGGLLVWGGSGYVYLMVVDDLRIGGMGFGGSSSLTGYTNGFNREVKYGMSGGAFTLEYTLPFIKRIAVSVGGMFGAGKITVDIYQNNRTFSWQDTWDEFNSDEGTQDFSRRMKNNYLTLTPTLNVDVPLTRFFAIRVGTGYQFTFSENWTVENSQQLNNVPSALNGNSFFIQMGLYLGFFAY